MIKLVFRLGQLVQLRPWHAMKLGTHPKTTISVVDVGSWRLVKDDSPTFLRYHFAFFTHIYKDITYIYIILYNILYIIYFIKYIIILFIICILPDLLKVTGEILLFTSHVLQPPPLFRNLKHRGGRLFRWPSVYSFGRLSRCFSCLQCSARHSNARSKAISCNWDPETKTHGKT